MVLFTIESGRSELHFLDLRISLSSQEWHTQEVDINCDIDSTSYSHPRHNKVSSTTLLNHLVSIRHEPYAFRKELDTIKCLANYNGILMSIEKIVKNKMTFRTLSRLTSLSKFDQVREKIKRLWLPYVRKFIAKMVRQKAVQLHTRLLKLRMLGPILSSLKNQVPSEEKKRVDRLLHSDCPALYEEGTDRRFRIHFKEYKRAYDTNLEKRHSTLSNTAPPESRP